MEESDIGPVWGHITEFAWRNWWKFKEQSQICGQDLSLKLPEYGVVVPTTEDEILKGNDD